MKPRKLLQTTCLILLSITHFSMAQSGHVNVGNDKDQYKLDEIDMGSYDENDLRLPLTFTSAILDKGTDAPGEPEEPEIEKILWALGVGEPTFDPLDAVKPSVVLSDLESPFVKTEAERAGTLTATYTGDTGDVNPSVRTKQFKLVKLDFWGNKSEDEDDDIILTYATQDAKDAATKTVLHWIPVKVVHSQSTALELRFEVEGEGTLYFHQGENPNAMDEEPTLTETLTASFENDGIVYIGTDEVGEGTIQYKVQGRIREGNVDSGDDAFKDAPEVKTLNLLPLELAPDVLCVNSDFDEGRIDPDTGYAIPDCDDENIALEAVREHLDGKFSVNERITDDMHLGWFGVNPSSMDHTFWNGATVTISKLNKNDPETNHPESGHVRFYGKWGDGAGEYKAIVPYEIDDLSVNNLVIGGINAASGQSVYGSNSPFPANTKFYMEGIHPGKITLEWRYQKGDVEITYEQEFEVYTKKSAPLWRWDLDYKIRLETSNDPSGIVRVIEYPIVADGYTVNIERITEYYDFYRECYLETLRSNPNGYSNALSWAGLARLAGSQVVGGLSDAEYARRAILLPSLLPNVYQMIYGWTTVELETLQLALFQGGWEIFSSGGWQHHAYRSSGVEAIEWVVDNYPANRDAGFNFPAWVQLHQGVLDEDEELIQSAALTMADLEQNFVIVDTWGVIDGLFEGIADHIFTIFGTNPCTPNGIRFTDVYPYPTGSLARTTDRWHWIKPATPGGVISQWNAESLARKKEIVGAYLTEDSDRFSLFSDPLPILSYDDKDVK